MVGVDAGGERRVVLGEHGDAGARVELGSSGATIRQHSHSSLTTTTSPSGNAGASWAARVVGRGHATRRTPTVRATHVTWARVRDHELARRLAWSGTVVSVRGSASAMLVTVSRRAGVDAVPRRRDRALRRQHVVRVGRRRPGRIRSLFDLGTGLRYFGLAAARPSRSTAPACVSHLHWDHVQGLPFFTPAAARRTRTSTSTRRSRRTTGARPREVLRRHDLPAAVPDRPRRCSPGTIDFHEPATTTFTIGERRGRCRASIPHVGNTLGYRRRRGTAPRVAYMSDHQQPRRRRPRIADGALELCDGVDLLIHDAQYTPAEFARKSTWGHCTVEYAVWLAGRGRVPSGWRCSTTTRPTTTT